MSKATHAAEAFFVPPEHRIQPLCPYAGVCGGCAWQQIDMETQREEKRRMVQEAFDAAKIEAKIPPVLGNDQHFHYRNRMDYCFGRDGQLGLKTSGRWWETLDLQTCFLLSPETPEILQRVREWTKSTGLTFWDVRTHEGFFRYLVIREGKHTNERLIMLIVSDQAELTAEQKKQFVELLDDKATSILIGVNDRITDLSIPSRTETLKGDPWLHEVVNGIRYRIQPASFFQTNTTMAAVLQNTVIDFCGQIDKKFVMDLYCGAGFFTLALAKAGAKTIGVEIDAAAIDAAHLNAGLNTLTAEFVASKAEEYDWKAKQPDVVIIDPPRAGLHPSVLATLTRALPERIIYVSCKYQRLLQELPELLLNYRLAEVRVLDLFPQTPHVEVVCQLIRL